MLQMRILWSILASLQFLSGITCAIGDLWEFICYNIIAYLNGIQDNITKISQRMRDAHMCGKYFVFPLIDCYFEFSESCRNFLKVTHTEDNLLQVIVHLLQVLES